jgi:hypothetical protein
MPQAEFEKAIHGFVNGFNRAQTRNIQSRLFHFSLQHTRESVNHFVPAVPQGQSILELERNCFEATA